MISATPKCHKCKQATQNGYCDDCEELEQIARANDRWWFVGVGVASLMVIALVILLFL